MTICIRNARWAVAWDAAKARHAYRQGVDIAFAGDRITHIGPGYRGPVESEIDGRGRLVLPGLVDVHSHLMSENLGRGLTEEVGNPALHMSGLYDAKSVFLVGHSMQAGAQATDGYHAATEMALAELLMSGVTTIVDLAVPYEGWLDGLARSGIRAVAAPMYRSAHWGTRNGFTVAYEWDEAAGLRAFEEALAVLDAAARHPSGRLSGMVAPAQIDTCTPDLLRRSKEAAEARRLPLTLHCGQSVWEFQEIVRRHGRTPVQFLAELGVLGSRTLLGHGIFLDHHSWIRWHSKEDLALLARAGTSIAHCPTVFSRYGQMLENIGGYLDAGVNVALGTDTQPHNMLEEMRLALILGRIAGQHVEAASAARVFEAATLGGARALERQDIGRLAEGAKADIVLVDLEHPAMRPAHDPLRALVFSAADRAIRDVYVGGAPVVADFRVLTIDREAAAGRLEAAQRLAVEAAPARDHAGRPAAELAPLAFPLMP